MKNAAQRIRTARTLGVLLQGFVLGTLLAFALFNLSAIPIGARIFRYQGF